MTNLFFKNFDNFGINVFSDRLLGLSLVLKKWRNNV